MSWNFFDSWVPKRSKRKPIQCTDTEFQTQKKKCITRYEDWEECVQTKGFNDTLCHESYLERYYTCVSQQEAMQAYLEDKDLT